VLSGLESGQFRSLVGRFRGIAKENRRIGKKFVLLILQGVMEILCQKSLVGQKILIGLFPLWDIMGT